MYSQACLELLEISKTEDDLNSHAKSNRDMYRQLKQETSFLPDKAYARERLWYVENNTKTPPHCKMCSNPVKWHNLDRKFQVYCSTKCTHNDPELRARLEATNLERYGNKCSAVNEEVKAKFIATNLERYGVEYPVQTEEVQTKRRVTNVERYGNEYAVCEQTRAKRKATCLAKYGVDHWMKVSEIATKIHHKVIQYYIRHPKVSSVSHIPEVHDIEYLNDQHNNQNLPLYQIAKNLNVSHSCITHRFHRFNIPIRYNPHLSYSEREVLEYIQIVYDGEIISGDRTILKPQEIDIYIPDLHIGFEFDGVRYHSEIAGSKSKNYHLEKTIKCELQGIQLIHIFESEWIHNRAIVESRIAHLLKSTVNKIYARKCTIEMVSSADATWFFKNTHLQGGGVKSSINFGLYHNDILVACMSFGKTNVMRGSTECEYELLRYSTVLNTSIVGGAARLFKAFIRQFNPQSVVTYSDRRWSQGKVYTQLGFTFSHNSRPNYFYFHSSEDRILYNRQHFQKHKLQSKLEHFDPSMTEWENMQVNGYDRVWDCGNGVWTWHNIK